MAGIVAGAVLLEVVVRKLTGGFSVFGFVLRTVFGTLKGIFGILGSVLGFVGRVTGLSGLLTAPPSSSQTSLTAPATGGTTPSFSQPVAGARPVLAGGGIVNNFNTVNDIRVDTIDASRTDDERVEAIVQRTLEDSARSRQSAVDSNVAY